MSIGVPVKLLHESQGHVITLELKTGQLYRGELIETEDNMNVQLKDITVTARDGQTSHLKHVYVRGSNVRFFIVPDMLKNAPMFQNLDPKMAKMRGIGMGRGTAPVSRTRGRGRGGSRGRGRGHGSN
ncbi:small nuclear ribonucleoprotein Sm D3 [Coemansia sp. RSA 518]|nr:small nuclear ribonucleoprotein Sm D3 [Coemansia sp. RSA 1591]KAJ1764639.1 small nuclear ribonucleoprotein Sm D3 [Coemansia sp. RSA 1752]KAJ2152315.1 small nuclear ribonucleoprotein Sm D3 [Coemansia sp. RSA 562]KAJ2157061.1 small nuclear ribonucleoprotein Sm D3 [Coemansia sp. RSA 560]KAJ2183532.1 small nuclear ribonucleoprotein Sm D3 [Coemansia sp. RSA 532]KAJ2186311.1 small nuclear ribonucleoprotein Sm D3 [Coemansia sp. RSA 522]KAJ2195100.1 small nuclear ribonucleoprotein Sm D3 [Coemansia